jgi:hypothetical protein
MRKRSKTTDKAYLQRMRAYDSLIGDFSQKEISLFIK